MLITKNDRGFKHSAFQDSSDNICTIQKSSIANDDLIWLGIDKPKLTIFEDENLGRYIVTEMPKLFRVYSRMHLNRKQVKELLPILQKFVDTGDLC